MEIIVKKTEMGQEFEPIRNEHQGIPGANSARRMGLVLAEREQGLLWGKPALQWWNEACSPALTRWVPGQCLPVRLKILPVQPSRWTCACFGFVPGLDGNADRLWAVVSKGRFRRKLDANTACAGLAGKAASVTATAARECSQAPCLQHQA